MDILDWAMLGGVLIIALIFCAKIMRRGRQSLDQDREACFARIREGEQQLCEERKQIAATEHLALMQAALADWLRLAGDPPGHSLSREGRTLLLDTPQGQWRVELVMRERTLKSTGQILHGRSRWLLHGFGQEEQHSDSASLMRSLNGHLRGEEDKSIEPDHLARRVGAIQARPDLRKIPHRLARHKR